MSPFERLRPLSGDLADKGNVALKALEVSPELGCGALRTWLEKGVIRYLEDKHQLEAITGTSAIERSINRLLEHGVLPKHLHDQFHRIRIHGNDAAHGETIEPTKAHSNFRYAAAIGDWLLTYVPAERHVPPQRPPLVQTPRPSNSPASEFERLFYFRKYRAMGDSTW